MLSDSIKAFVNIVFFLLNIVSIIGLFLGIPFIIYGAIKKKKGFIIAGVIGLISLPILIGLYGLFNLAISG